MWRDIGAGCGGWLNELVSFVCTCQILDVWSCEEIVLRNVNRYHTLYMYPCREACTPCLAALSPKNPHPLPWQTKPLPHHP